MGRWCTKLGWGDVKIDREKECSRTLGGRDQNLNRKGFMLQVKGRLGTT